MATSVHVDANLSQYIEDVTSLPIMKIQGTNYQLEANVSQYPEELKMLVVALKSSVMSKAIFSSFSVPMSWLSQAGSTATYNKAFDVITFNLVNHIRSDCPRNSFVKFLKFQIHHRMLISHSLKLSICSMRWVINHN